MPRIRGDCYPVRFTGTHPLVIEKERKKLQKRIDEELKYYSSVIDETTCWYQKSGIDEMNKAHDKHLQEEESYHCKIFTQLIPFFRCKRQQHPRNRMWLRIPFNVHGRFCLHRRRFTPYHRGVLKKELS